MLCYVIACTLRKCYAKNGGSVRVSWSKKKIFDAIFLNHDYVNLAKWFIIFHLHHRFPWKEAGVPWDPKPKRFTCLGANRSCEVSIIWLQNTWSKNCFDPNDTSSHSVWKPREWNIKEQLGVPLKAYPWYLLCSLGILGDHLPINTHEQKRAYITGFPKKRGTLGPGAPCNGISKTNTWPKDHMCHGQKSRFVGDKLIPPFLGILIMGI